MLRIYLTGEVMIESGAALVRERSLPGNQGRVVFAMLAAEHHRTIGRDELVKELWGETPPASWDTALRAILSKLRSVLSDLVEPPMLAAGPGAYQLQLVAGSFVDIEAAHDAVHRAEASLRSGDLEDAVGWGLVARSVTRSPLLPGHEGPWAHGWRRRLLDVRLRSFDVMNEVWLSTARQELAIHDAQEALGIDPFRETSLRHLMRGHQLNGDSAKALQAYEACRSLLADELGTSPSKETEAIYLNLLGA